MFAMLLSTAAFFAAEDKPAAPAISLDGNWVVLAAEKDGKPIPDAKNMTVTAKGDTITCSGKDGKPAVTMKVEFAPNGTVKVMETSGSGTTDKPIAKVGVYVLTNDFLALCVHDANGTGTATNQTNKCAYFLNRSGTRPNDR